MFKPTVTHRRKVEEWVSGGMSEDECAIALGISTPTLRKYFETQLVHGRAKRRAEVISLLYATARKGNVSAQKKLEEMTGVAAAAASWNGDTKPERRGKKEEAAEAAANAGAGTEWGDDLQFGGRPN